MIPKIGKSSPLNWTSCDISSSISAVSGSACFTFKLVSLTTEHHPPVSSLLPQWLPQVHSFKYAHYPLIFDGRSSSPAKGNAQYTVAVYRHLLSLLSTFSSSVQVCTLSKYSVDVDLLGGYKDTQSCAELLCHSMGQATIVWLASPPAMWSGALQQFSLDPGWTEQLRLCPCWMSKEN